MVSIKSIKQKKYSALLLLLCLGWAGFIFYNSTRTGSVSDQQSFSIVDRLAPFFSQVLPFLSREFLNFLVRKAAHTLEFMLLGALLTAMFAAFPLPRRRTVFPVLFLGLVSGCIDEQIQLFTPGRSSEVRDVFIDFTGAVLGMLLVFVVISLVRRAKRSRISART